MGDDPALRRLVERGRDLASAAEQRAVEQARAEVDGKAREKLMKRLASVSFYTRFGWILATLALCVPWFFLLRAVIPRSWFEGDMDGDPGTGVIVLTMALLFIPTWFLRRPVGEWAWRREKAWVAGLPFPLTGYPDVLDRGSTDCVVRIQVAFAGATPDPATLEAVLRNLGTVEEGGKAVRRTFDWTDSEGGGPMTNAFVRTHVRDAVKKLLVLHASYPLGALKVQVS